MTDQSRKEVASVVAQLVREHTAGIVAGLEKEIVALVMDRLAQFEARAAQGRAIDEEFHSDLMVTPLLKGQH